MRRVFLVSRSKITHKGKGAEIKLGVEVHCPQHIVQREGVPLFVLPQDLEALEGPDELVNVLEVLAVPTLSATATRDLCAPRRKTTHMTRLLVLALFGYNTSCAFVMI